ncbi:unnamed protein product [Meloidogyne enterolobii]|uniref:Uncharacterized protein n=1 Tax=Meloidogyne enterolobii TaxID=390850 RepID=A0ACB1A8M9_MELEN
MGIGMGIRVCDLSLVFNCFRSGSGIRGYTSLAHLVASLRPNFDRGDAFLWIGIPIVEL